MSNEPVMLARGLRDEMIHHAAVASRALLLAESEIRIVDSIQAVSEALDAAVKMTALLHSSSSVGYAERDLDIEVRENLAAARSHIAKLKKIHYPTDGTTPA